MKRIGVVWLCLLLFFSGTIVGLDDEPITIETPNPKPDTLYTPHTPITINSNADFDEAHGVVNWATGSGNDSNPWIIEGWEIDGISDINCIFIRGTTDYFIVRDCYLYNFAPMMGAGIMLRDQRHGKLQNNIIMNGGDGIFLRNSVENVISNNNVSHCVRGIYIYYGEENNITGNYIFENDYGICFGEYSIKNVISGNTISNNLRGILFQDSELNSVVNNTIFYNRVGIWLSDETNSTMISYNNISFNQDSGIIISDTYSITLKFNVLRDDGITIQDTQLSSWNTHDIDTSNTVNGKPVYYWKNQTGGTISSGAGQVILANCSGVTIQNQYIHNCVGGIAVGHSDNITIVNNTVISNSIFGISLYESHDNIVTNNFVSSVVWYGIHLRYSNNNTITGNNVSFSSKSITLDSSSFNLIYHNTFFNNPGSNEAYDDGWTNSWDNGYPSGGNYYSDYSGIDIFSGPAQDQPGSDGFGDTNYSILGSYDIFDEYPLMKPTEFVIINYTIPLTEGWNLLSLPLEQSSELLSGVLASIDGKWDCAQYYDALDSSWKSHNIYRPDSLNDLDSLDHKMGFWINIIEPNVNLTVRGSIPGPTSINMYAGWNLVGYPTMSTEIVANALLGTGADHVEVFDPAEPYRIREVGPGYLMKPGEGYWVHVPADTVWVVDW